MPANSVLLERVEELERENIALKVQVLRLVKDLANIVSICNGHLKESGWEWPVNS